MKTKILGSYRIEYIDNNVVQYKDLIRHEDYIFIKQQENTIYELEKQNKFNSTPESSRIKNELSQMFGNNYFTDGSPLFKAISTNILTLPLIQGGNHNVKITKNI